jgi:hypothetical protein
MISRKKRPMQKARRRNKGVKPPPDLALSSRLSALLDAVFAAPRDPFGLYWDVAGLMRDEERILVSKRIRKNLRQTGEIPPESAMLSACILSLCGFPAHRVLHFLSIYFKGGLSQSLFDLAVGACFLGDPPVDASLLYDMTQYTYLEKRLLVRRSMEISDLLKERLNPRLLLYLYLLSLRSDLSNEHIQLISLIMKNCFPAQEVRTRLGMASLEEYGEIARAWREAEERSITAEAQGPGGAVKPGKRAFDLDKASFFLDKYFSDAALEKMRAEAPPLAVPKIPPRLQRPDAADGEERRRAAEPSVDLAPGPGLLTGRSREARPLPRAEAPAVKRAPAKPAAVPASFAIRPQSDSPSTTAQRPQAREERPEPPRRKTAARGAPAVPRQRKQTSVRRSRPAAARRPGLRTRLRGLRARGVPSLRRLLPWLPPSAAALGALAFLLAAPGLLPIPPRAAAAPVPVASTPAPAPQPSAPSAPSPSQPSTYVVREGDSLWTIFQRLEGPEAGSRGWVDFLSRTQTRNGIQNPDHILPGRVLTLGDSGG